MQHNHSTLECLIFLSVISGCNITSLLWSASVLCVVSYNWVQHKPTSHECLNFLCCPSYLGATYSFYPGVPQFCVRSVKTGCSIYSPPRFRILGLGRPKAGQDWFVHLLKSNKFPEFHRRGSKNVPRPFSFWTSQGHGSLFKWAMPFKFGGKLKTH